MARNRREYEDVMDVKLRATLKELGFKRKTPSTYVFERSTVTWVFELEQQWKWGRGFFDSIGVVNFEMERIFRDVLEHDWVRYAPMRNKCHVATSIPQLVAIELKGGPIHPLARRHFEWPPNVNNVLEYYWKDAWRPRRDPVEHTLTEARERLYRERIAEFGPYFEEMFRRYALPWYKMSERSREFAQWYEDHTWPEFPKVICAIVAHHVAGNKDRAKELIRRLVVEGDMTFDQVLRDVCEWHRVRAWMHWPILRTIYKPEEYQDIARADLELIRIAARKAQSLASAFGY